MNLQGGVRRHRETARASKEVMMDLVCRVDDDFLDKPRREQVLELVANMDGYNVTRKYIARLVKVSESLVTRIKHYGYKNAQTTCSGWLA